MLIDVGFSDWEQHCCGESRAVGEATTFTTFVANSFTTPDATRPAFYATWHDASPHGADYVEVTGIVTEIRAVFYDMMPDPLHPGAVTANPATRTEVSVGTLLSRAEVDELPEDDETQEPWWSAWEFIATLEVADSSLAPPAGHIASHSAEGD